VSGRIQPGAILNGEIEASERLHVSRTAIPRSGAHSRCEGHGRIAARKFGNPPSVNRGAGICSIPTWISWIFSADQPDERLLEALFEMRTIIEPAGGPRSPAERRTEGPPSGSAHGARSDGGEIARRLCSGSGLPIGSFIRCCSRLRAMRFLASFTRRRPRAGVAWTTIYKQRKSPLARDPIPDHEAGLRCRGERRSGRRAPGGWTTLIRLALLDTTPRRQKKKPTRGQGEKSPRFRGVRPAIPPWRGCPTVRSRGHKGSKPPAKR